MITIWTANATLPAHQVAPALLIRWQDPDADDVNGVTPAEVLRIVAAHLEQADPPSKPAEANAAANAVLDTPMQDNDPDATTIREYLKALLTTLWDEGEGFSGKRPFGNSGWKYEVYSALVMARLVGGSFDSDGALAQVDDDDADALILDAIEAL